MLTYEKTMTVHTIGNGGLFILLTEAFRLLGLRDGDRVLTRIVPVEKTHGILLCRSAFQDSE